MKSVFNRSAIGRRAATGTVLALAAATLSLGVAGSASAVTTTDLEGTVTGVGGAPLADMCVDVYDATTDDQIDGTCTDVAGHYAFTNLSTGQVKLKFYDDTSFEFAGDTQYLDRWYGGSRYQGNATAVAVTEDGDRLLDFAMTPAAVLAGSVAAADGHELTQYYGVDIQDADLDWPNYEQAWDGIDYRIAIEPGTYVVGGYGQDSSPSVGYLEKWWVDADTMASATPVAVSSGQTVAGIDLRLTNALTARQAPSISGVPAVGRVLSASPGTWNRNARTEFSYTWMRGATVVGTGATYAPIAADFGQRLNVIVRALNNENAGQAASAQTDAVRWAADAKGTAKALAGHKVRFAVKIVSAKQSPVRGKVVVLRGNKAVHKAVKLIKGKAVITVKHQPKGKQAFTVLYKGNPVLAKATKNFTVRVR